MYLALRRYCLRKTLTLHFATIPHRAEEQDKRMKEVRKKLKQLARKKREEQVGKKKADKKMKKLQKAG